MLFVRFNVFCFIFCIWCLLCFVIWWSFFVVLFNVVWNEIMDLIFFFMLKDVDFNFVLFFFKWEVMFVFDEVSFCMMRLFFWFFFLRLLIEWSIVVLFIFIFCIFEWSLLFLVDFEWRDDVRVWRFEELILILDFRIFNLCIILVWLCLWFENLFLNLVFKLSSFVFNLLDFLLRYEVLILWDFIDIFWLIKFVLMIVIFLYNFKFWSFNFVICLLNILCNFISLLFVGNFCFL